jgi:predicted Zn-dependent protease with MMP-like domain
VSEPTKPDGQDGTDLDVDAVIEDVLQRLPGPFRDQLGSVAIVVEDDATPEQLARLQVPGLFGL